MGILYLGLVKNLLNGFSVLDPRNMIGPSFHSNQSSSSAAPTTSPTNQPTNSSAPKQLKTGAKTGIGVGVVGGIILAVAAASTFLYCRKRSLKLGAERNADRWTGKAEGKLGELSSNPLHELPQLETKESAVELPAGYVSYQEIGRAF